MKRKMRMYQYYYLKWKFLMGKVFSLWLLNLCLSILQLHDHKSSGNYDLKGVKQNYSVRHEVKELIATIEGEHDIAYNKNY